MADYIITSYATEGSRYVECVFKQRRLYGKKYIGHIFKSAGRWAENTKLKPAAIRSAFGSSNIVLWLDSDCEIDPPSSAPDGCWDIGIIDNCHPLHKLRVSAGFILFRNTEKTQAFLDEWDRLNGLHKKDHPAFVEALMTTDAKVENVTEWLKGRHKINSLAKERGEYAG